MNVVVHWAGKRPCIVRRCGAALRRIPAETRLAVAAEKSWGMLERSNDLFRVSSDGGFSDGDAATHCAPPEFSCESGSREFWRGAGGSVDRYVSRRNAPRLDFLRYNRTTKIPCAKELSQAEQEVVERTGGEGRGQPWRDSGCDACTPAPNRETPATKTQGAATPRRL